MLEKNCDHFLETPLAEESELKIEFFIPGIIHRGKDVKLKLYDGDPNGKNVSDVSGICKLKKEQEGLVAVTRKVVNEYCCKNGEGCPKLKKDE